MIYGIWKVIKFMFQTTNQILQYGPSNISLKKTC